MRVRIGETGNNRPPLQVDDLCRRSLVSKYCLIGSDSLNPSTGNRQRLSPWSFRISGIDVAVNKKGIAGKKSGWEKNRDGGATNRRGLMAFHHLSRFRDRVYTTRS